jgi:hypothetical protein
MSGFYSRMSIMSNPHVLPGESSLNHYLQEEGRSWFGTCHLYNHLSPFLFGEDVDEVLRSFFSAQEVRNRLTILNGKSRRVLVKFLESVQARAVRDIAINFWEEFVQHWMLQDEGVYGEWD